MTLNLNNRHTIKDTYKKYKYYDKPKHPHYVSDYKTYRGILKDFFAGLSQMLINESIEYKIPHGLGRLYIKKFKPKRKTRYIDWANTKKYGKRIFHNNEHSSGYAARFYWYKGGTLAKGISLYMFKPTRNNARTLAKAIKYTEVIKDYKV